MDKLRFTPIIISTAAFCSSMAYASTVLDTVYQNDPFGFWKGGFDPKKVADTMGYTKQDVADISHIKPASVRYDARAPQPIMEHMEHIANICSIAAELFDNNIDKTLLWMNTQNPVLGDITPKLMIRAGKYQKLHKFLLEARKDRQAPDAQ